MLLFMTLGNFSNSSYSPLAPFIKNSYVLTSAELGLITSSIFIGTVTVSFFSGLLVDRLGPYTALRISFAIMASGAAVIFIADSYPVLIAGYFSIGLGYGIITPSTNSVTMDSYYPKHAPMMGIKQSGVPLGLMFSVVLLPFLALRYSLKISFLIMFLIAISIALILPREKHTSEGVSLRKGYLKDLLKAGRDKAVLSVAASVIFLSWGQQTLLTFFIIFQESKGVPLGIAEIFLMLLLVGSIFGRLFWAFFSDRVFHRNRVRTLSLIMALSGLLFILFNFSSSYYPIAALFSFVIGMNAVGWNSNYVTVISEIAPRAKVGLFTGASFVFTGLGTIIGTPLSGLIRDSASFFEMWIILGSALLVMSMIFLLVGGKFVRSYGDRAESPQ